MRPHGGFKGVSNYYPPSLTTFDKPDEYIADAKHGLQSQMLQEQNRLHGSPEWAWRANERRNHTGEQPLIVQQFLAANKQEQADGVLPAATSPPQRFRSKSANSFYDQYGYQQGNMAHQFLTATELPGQSERIVDPKHGRPTRTSLLRARQRTPSAPGVRATITIRNNMHVQQNLAARREEKYKSVDIPEDLLPITDDGETVHQFLVGARYNRTHYRDAKCLNNLGLYVSRDNSKNCFLQLSSSHNDADHRGQPNMSPPVYPPTKTLPSRRPHSVRFPIKSKQAWTTTGGSIASAPNTSPNDSRETFSSGAESTKSGPKSTLIDGSHLSQRRDSVGSTKSSQSDDSCVLCQSGKLVQKGCNPAWSLPKRNSHNPARVWSGKKSNREPRQSFPKDVASNKTSKSLDITSKNREVRKPLHSWQKTYDHMLVQQYHLRILGTRAGVHDGVASAPRSNFIYQNARTKPKTEETKNDENKNNDHKNATGDLNAKLKDQPGTDAENQSRLSSRISVRISSSNQQGDDKVVHDVDKSPRSEDVNLGSTQMSDANDEVTTREDLTKLVEEIEISGKEDGKGVGGEGVGGEGVDGEGVVAEGVDGKGVDGEGVDREGVVAEGVGGEGVDGEGVNGEGVDRESVDGEGVVAEGVDGEGVVGEGVVAEGVDGEGVDGEGLDREGVVVEGVVAEGVDGDGDEEVGDGDVGGTVPSEAVIDQKICPDDPGEEGDHSGESDAVE